MREGRTTNERRTTEDRATQPMEAGGNYVKGCEGEFSKETEVILVEAE